MDYQASGSEQEEDETTIAEQEEVEGTTDVQAELDALQQEGLFWLFMAGCIALVGMAGKCISVGWWG